MEPTEYNSRAKSQRQRRRWLCIVLAVIFISIAVAVVCWLTLGQRGDTFKDTFMTRCEQAKGSDCEKIWAAFEKAYVGRDPCRVPIEAYQPLIEASPMKPSCNRMMFWSKTKDMVHKFTDSKDCYVTLEDTVLGSVLDGLTWCGKEGSNETFTTHCPGWSECVENPVRSFWYKASAAFAESACGDVSAMLNGSIATPFSPLSIFGGVEVKKFNSSTVKTLNVVLVTKDNSVSNCTNASLKDLRKELDKGIKYNCKEVTETRILDCISHPEEPCGSCW